MPEITIMPVAARETVVPEATEGRTAGSFFADLLVDNGLAPQENDILVVSSKVVSFFESGLIRLDEIRPSRKARILAWAFRRDPRKLQVLMETGKVLVVIPMKRILKIPGMRRAMIERAANPEAMLTGYGQLNAHTFVVRAHAAYLDEAGIDHTNSPEGYIGVLPPDPSATAANIRQELRQRFGVDMAVIITDTVTCIGRLGSQDRAIGFAGIDPITRATFSDDLFGVPRSGGIDVVVDSIAGMAGLVMGQTTEKIPAVVVRGLDYAPERAEDAGARMTILEYPPGAQWRIVLYTILSTAWFKLANLASLQRWPRRTRAK